jgi:hypothetical protein
MYCTSVKEIMRKYATNKYIENAFPNKSSYCLKVNILANVVFFLSALAFFMLTKRLRLVHQRTRDKHTRIFSPV